MPDPDWKKRNERRLRQRDLREKMEAARLSGNERELSRLLEEYQALWIEMHGLTPWGCLNDRQKYDLLMASQSGEVT